MLKSLKFKNVGPAPELEIELGPRLNFLTGDNGLGKTFLLDSAWWALTRTWARRPLVPHRPPVEARIGYSYTIEGGEQYDYTGTFDRGTEQWSLEKIRPVVPSLVIYAQVDGGFSVWDPARNHWSEEVAERPASYLFTAEEVWEGNPLCEGLIRDWASWQREDGEAFRHLVQVLKKLSPSSDEPLEPGALQKVSLDDPRRHPTLKMPYGQEVPLIHASAGMRRIVALAYLLVWTWQEHLEACRLRGEEPAEQVILLIDEIEAHLHPQWQRRMVGALLEVMEALTGDHSINIQLITATHSPLVLASAEPSFDSAQDSLFLVDLNGPSEGHQVTLDKLAWSKQGDVVGWLVSETFGLRQGRSLEAERAIEAAEAWMRGDAKALPEKLSSAEQIDSELRHVLAGHDPFWPRWVVWVERQAEAGGP